MEPVAITGLSCRFPGAPDPDRFWELLSQGREAIRAMPEDRLALWQALGQSKAAAPRGGYLETIDAFEPEFFGLSPREAARMDPQQRLLLELAWEAIEDAGLAPRRLAETRTGVYVGIMNADHALAHGRALPMMDAHLGIGSSLGIAANRISYAFDLRGPSLAVDTLCSSSLVAVHLACEALASDPEMPLALAGGVNIMSFPAMHLFYADAGLLSPDARCRAFDAGANGIVRGEGGGFVVLKRLSDARRDGDPIYCVVRGSAVNQDGKSNGLTAPNRFAQERVLAEAYRRAGVSPGAVQFVEAHGTGTLIGDPIELKALGAVLGRDRPAGSRCAIGSVKSNFGHLESAAGIAALVKTALSLQHRQLCPSLHFKAPNPYVRWADLPLRVVTAGEPWPESGGLPLAGVSSFGLGGTNAHLVLEGVEPSYRANVRVRTHAFSRRPLATELTAHLRSTLPGPDEGLLYEVVWERSEPGSREPAGAWLVVGGPEAILAALRRRPSESPCLVLETAEAQALLGADFEDWPALIRHATQRLGAAPRVIVHGLALQAEASNPEALDAAQRAGYRSVLALVKVLDAAGSVNPVRLWVATEGARSLPADLAPAIAQAPLVGLGKVVRLEHPELWGGLVDLDPRDAPADAAQALLTTLEAGDEEPEVAWRAGVRYVPRLVRRSGPPREAPDVRRDGTYLITGGFGGLGLAIAGWLVEGGARHVALLGRRGRTADTEAAVAALEARGVEVRSWAVDVADARALAAVLGELDASMRPLVGVFHAAGVLEDKLLYRQDWADFEAVFAPKARGAWNLHRLTQERSLECFVLFSSIAAVLGSPGQANYAAANAFLDALAAHRAAAGLPATAVNWGPWASVGMAARAEAPAAPGLRALPPEEALRALGGALAAPTTLLTIASVDWAALFAGSGVARSLPILARLRARDATPARAWAAPTAEALPPFETLVATLKEAVAGVLELPLEQVSGELSLDRLGLDSLLGVELQDRIEKAFGRSLPVASLFDASIEGLAAQLLGSPERPRPEATSPLPEGSWLVPVHVDPAARLRLFCFAYAGGAAHVYRSWARGLGPGIEIWAIELPGRGARRHEPLVTRVSEIVEALVPALLPRLDRPFAFFGHCLGAIVMFETARRLARDHALQAHELFASGAPAPPLYLIPQVYGRSDDRFREVLELIRFASSEPLLRDPELLRRALPSVRADFEAASAYQFTATPGDDGVLDTPITSFGAWEDVFAPQAAIEPWRERTRGAFSLFMRPGEHYFLETERAFLHDVISRRLADAAPTPRPDTGAGISVPVPRPAARQRLFCFPHLGGDARTFEPWARALPADVEVVCLELPASGDARLAERAEGFAAALRPWLDRPFAFFGHDLGALLLLETTHALTALDAPLPGRLFVSSAMAPHLNFFPPVHVFGEERLRDLVRFFGLDAPLESSHRLRRDFELVATYKGAAGRRLSIPITAFAASEDTLVPGSGVEGWREHTEAAFEILRREGGHDSWREHAGRRALIDAVAARLRD